MLEKVFRISKNDLDIESNMCSLGCPTRGPVVLNSLSAGKKIVEKPYNVLVDEKYIRSMIPIHNLQRSVLHPPQQAFRQRCMRYVISMLLQPGQHILPISLDPSSPNFDPIKDRLNIRFKCLLIISQPFPCHFRAFSKGDKLTLVSNSLKNPLAFSHCSIVVSESRTSFPTGAIFSRFRAGFCIQTLEVMNFQRAAMPGLCVERPWSILYISSFEIDSGLMARVMVFLMQDLFRAYPSAERISVRSGPWAVDRWATSC